MTFGIHEMVSKNELPSTMLDTLKAMSFQFERDSLSYVIGYVRTTDSSALQLDASDMNIKLIRTAYPVDKEQQYYAIIAIRPTPLIDNDCLQQTKSKGNAVVIFFNMDGAARWARFTKENIGYPVAFLLDGQLYDMPFINGEILNGMTMINGLANEETASTISSSLNSN